MSEVNHTPGPWVVDDEMLPSYIRPKGTGWMIAAMREPDGTEIGKRTEANARLIAAAPELLDALTAFVHDPDDPDSCFCGGRFNVFGDQSKPSHSDACNKARAAIAKATGKEAE